MKAQIGDQAAGHHYEEEYECNSRGDCDGAVTKSIGTCSAILLSCLLVILVILGITGHSITIMIGDSAAASVGMSPPDYLRLPPSRTSPFSRTTPYRFGKGDDGISFSSLLDHERNSTVTAEEEAILRTVFTEYDGDADGLWSYSDFTAFMEDHLQSDTTFAFLDSKTNDGYLDYDELVMIFSAFDSIPLLHTDEINELLVDVTGLPLEEAKEQEPQVLAELMMDEMDHGEDGISKEEWTDYVISEEWDEFNDDKDTFVDFSEFERDFFESTMFLTFQECLHEEACANPTAAIQAFDDATIVHYARRRLQSLSIAPRRRRLFFMIPVIAAGVIFVATMVYVEWHDYEGCYDDKSFVSVMRESLVPQTMPIKDVVVGDFVYDGNEFSKVYYLQHYQENHFVNMLEIKYGIPSDEQSITVTPAHLLYRDAAPLPVRSDEVMIGDVLWGVTEYSYGDGFNFTVYDISTVQRIPINPITMSSDLMVNGIKTSVYTHSVVLRDSMQSAGAFFRWTSNNIDERITQSVCESLINAYKGAGLRAQDMHSFIQDNEALLGVVYTLTPLVLGVAMLKAMNRVFANQTTKKRI